MKRLARSAVAILAFLAPVAAAYGQGAVLQGGSWAQGHVPCYVSSGGQTVVIDCGAARGGGVGTGASELAITSRGTGTPPYVGQGTGPNGSTFCLYDAPIDNPTGYHYLCLSPNATGGAGLLSFGAAGGASNIALNFDINGTPIVGVTCSGSPTSSFASINGIVTHC